jgi:hypothetical protein
MSSCFQNNGWFHPIAIKLSKMVTPKPKNIERF